MSHPEQQAFLSEVARLNPMVVASSRVLEIGSYDVNGTIRGLFADAHEYIGVDLKPGPGVDVVAYGHEIAEDDGSYGIVVSGECFEHDPHWRQTFQNMVRLTKPGGIVAFTCASSGRPEHGTKRTLTRDSPGTQAEGLDYYRNLTADDFSALPMDEWFSSWRFWYMPTTFDLYFAGIRPGGHQPLPSLPSDTTVEKIRRLMPLRHRAVRVPLRVARRLVGDGDRYQKLILPYWLGLIRIFGVQDRHT